MRPRQPVQGGNPTPSLQHGPRHANRPLAAGPIGAALTKQPEQLPISSSWVHSAASPSAGLNTIPVTCSRPASTARRWSSSTARHKLGEHHLARGGAQLGRNLAQDGQPLLVGGMVIAGWRRLAGTGVDPLSSGE
jgi:hypothetical protein